MHRVTAASMFFAHSVFVPILEQATPKGSQLCAFSAVP